MTPKFSFAGTCNRPHIWPKVFAALEQNDSDFEVILCGDVGPDYELPAYARWIEARVKPAQCAEIAMRECRGELWSVLVDDLEYSPGCLDEAWARYSASADGNVIVSPLYHNPFDYPGQSPEELTRWAQRFDVRDPNSPPIPVQGFIPAVVATAIGGFDRRFVAVQQDVDWFMRAQAHGGARVEFLRNGTVTERNDWSGPHVPLSSRHHFQHDRPLVESLWVRAPGTPFGWERTSELDPFGGDLLTGNQGRVEP